MTSHAQNFDYSQSTYNKKGRLDGLQQYIYNKKVEYEHLYKDGVIQEATNHIITVKGESPLRGIYKNGKPFKGYFVNPDNSMELNIVDYYEGGIQIAQFSKPLNLDQDLDVGVDYYSSNFKTDYKNGQVWNGVQYHQYKLEGNSFLLATENFKEGVLQNVELLIGAVHYAEVLDLAFNESGYVVTTKEGFERPAGNITVTFTGNQEGKVTSFGQFEFYNGLLGEPIPDVWGEITYYKMDQEYYFQHITNIEILESEYEYNSNLTSTILQVFMNKVPVLARDKKNNYSEIFSLNSEFHNKLLLTEGGTPFLGVLLTKGSVPETFSIFKYKNGKLVFSKENLSEEEFEKITQFNDEDFRMD